MFSNETILNFYIGTFKDRAKKSPVAVADNSEWFPWMHTVKSISFEENRSMKSNNVRNLRVKGTGKDFTAAD